MERVRAVIIMIVLGRLLASCVTQLTGSSLRPVDRSISGKRDISVILRQGHGAVITEMFQVCFLLIFLEAYALSELSGL